MTEAAKDSVRQHLANAGPPSDEDTASPSAMRPSDEEDDYSFVSSFKKLPLPVTDSGSLQM